MVVLPSGLNDVVGDDEELARYLTSSSHFNRVMVKPAAFLPREGETSVFRHGSEPRERLWQLANDYAVGDRTLHGAAIFEARDVRAVLLNVEAIEPPPRHANIIGWPSSSLDPELARAEQKEQALVIAQRARLLLR